MDPADLRQYQRLVSLCRAIRPDIDPTYVDVRQIFIAPADAQPALAATVAAFNWADAAALAAFELEQQRVASAAGLNSGTNVITIGTRAALRVLISLFNPCRVAVGLPPVATSDFVPKVYQGVLDGIGDDATKPIPANAEVGIPGRQVRTARVPTGTVLAGGTLVVPVPWPTPFADANYTLSDPTVVGAGGLLFCDGVFDLTKDGCKVRLRNLTSLLVGVLGAPLSGTLHVVATHD